MVPSAAPSVEVDDARVSIFLTFGGLMTFFDEDKARAFRATLAQRGIRAKVVARRTQLNVQVWNVEAEE